MTNCWEEMITEYSHSLNSFLTNCSSVQGENSMLKSGEMRDDLVCVFNIWIINGDKWTIKCFQVWVSDSNTSQQPETYSGCLILRKYQENRDWWVFYSIWVRDYYTVKISMLWNKEMLLSYSKFVKGLNRWNNIMFVSCIDEKMLYKKLFIQVEKLNHRL